MKKAERWKFSDLPTALFFQIITRAKETIQWVSLSVYV